MKKKFKKLFLISSPLLFVIALLVFLLFFIWLIRIFSQEEMKIWKDVRPLIDWGNIRVINWTSITAIASLISAFAVFSQAFSTRKISETTLKPRISVGISSLGLTNISLKENLMSTRLIINNSSDLTAFVWTKLDLKIDNKDAPEKYFRSPDFCLGNWHWEIDPHGLIGPFIFKESIIPDVLSQTEQYDEKKIVSIGVKVYYSSDSELPKNPKWIELKTYSFRDSGQWLKNEIGIPYFLSK